MQEGSHLIRVKENTKYVNPLMGPFNFLSLSMEKGMIVFTLTDTATFEAVVIWWCTMMVEIYIGWLVVVRYRKWGDKAAMVNRYLKEETAIEHHYKWS
nr:hypothetical protein [Providencia stuartii]